MKVGMMEPMPGRIPSRKPSTLPRAMGAADRRQSSRVGQRPRTRVRNTSCLTPRSMFSSTSLIPKSPMIMGTSPTPSLRVRLP
jgi:hypothetical protein